MWKWDVSKKCEVCCRLILYLLYTFDRPAIKDVTVATFTDDTALIRKFQIGSNRLITGINQRKVKLNDLTTLYVTETIKKLVDSTALYVNRTDHFTLRKHCLVSRNKLRSEATMETPYWKTNSWIKLEVQAMPMAIRTIQLLSIHNKIMIYYQILKPVWLYARQLWGCANKTNIWIENIKTSQGHQRIDYSKKV